MPSFFIKPTLVRRFLKMGINESDDFFYEVRRCSVVILNYDKEAATRMHRERRGALMYSLLDNKALSSGSHE